MGPARRTDKELATGRRLDSGAPLTGEEEHDEPDFTALGPPGSPGSRTSRTSPGPTSPTRRKILRRPYNYDGAPTAQGTRTPG